MTRVVGLALQSVRSRWSRAALTGISLVLGILSVVAVQSVASVAEQILLRDAEISQGRNGSVYASLPATPANRQLARTLVRTLPGSVLLLRGTGAYVVSQGGVAVNVDGFAGDLLAVYPFGAKQVRAGQTLMNVNAATALGSKGEGSYYDPEDLVARKIVVKSVFNQGSSGALILAPEETIGSGATQAELRIQYYNPNMSSDAAKDMLEARAAWVGIPELGQITTVDVLTGLRLQLDVLRLGFQVAAAVTLLVGVLAVLNIGLTELAGRSEELALRRSLGATRADILRLVLIEGGLVGLASSILAVSLSSIAYLVWVRRLVPGMVVDYPIAAAVAGLVAGLAAGLIGSLIPAVKASKMVIAEIMRA